MKGARRVSPSSRFGSTGPGKQHRVRENPAVPVSTDIGSYPAIVRINPGQSYAKRKVSYPRRVNSMIGALIAKSSVQRGYDSMARGDLDTFLSIFSEDAIVIYPTKGTIKGKEAVGAFYRHFVHTFPKVNPVALNVGVENIFDLIGTNVISVHFEISTTNRKGITFKQEGMQLIRIKHGKLVHLHYFFFDTENLRHAWAVSE
jgi:ketosteroid isomerase-like protein